MRRFRVAIFGASPCGGCHAACCRQQGHEFAAILTEDEARRFRVFSRVIRVARGGTYVTEHVLPYVEGRCRFLGTDDRCSIYPDRPRACREFECTRWFRSAPGGGHGGFLEHNPRVLALLESL